MKEDPLDTLSPREIQSRIRTGATVAELAEDSGMSVEAIERFSGPPLAERAYVSDQARACVVRPGTEDLQAAVARSLGSDEAALLDWDSWRREDGRWTVVASLPDGAAVSTWIYDPRSRSVHPDDAGARRLASEDVVVPLRSSTATVALVADVDRSDVDRSDVDRSDVDRSDVGRSTEAEVLEVAEPGVEAVQADLADILELAEVADSQGAEAPEESAVTDDDASAARPRSRKGRRASVPRWDEILFGAGQPDA